MKIFSHFMALDFFFFSLQENSLFDKKKKKRCFYMARVLAGQPGWRAANMEYKPSEFVKNKPFKTMIFEWFKN